MAGLGSGHFHNMAGEAVGTFIIWPSEAVALSYCNMAWLGSVHFHNMAEQ